MMKILTTLLILLTLLTGSCATDSKKAITENSDTAVLTPTPAVSLYHENPDIPWIWDCLPRDGMPVYFAVSGLRQKREEEKTWALRSAAVQSAQFESISGSMDYLMQRSSVSFGRIESDEVFFNQETALRIFDRLEVIEETSNHDGTYILARNPDQKINIDYEIKYKNGTPTWITHIPVIPGYVVAVGSVKMHRTLTDSLAAADRASFLEMLGVLFGRIDSQRDEIIQSGETRENSANITTTQITASGEIRNFLVIARWRDKQHNYYSLAVCPETH